MIQSRDRLFYEVIRGDAQHTITVHNLNNTESTPYLNISENIQIHQTVPSFHGPLFLLSLLNVIDG